MKAAPSARGWRGAAPALRTARYAIRRRDRGNAGLYAWHGADAGDCLFAMRAFCPCLYGGAAPGLFHPGGWGARGCRRKNRSGGAANSHDSGFHICLPAHAKANERNWQKKLAVFFGGAGANAKHADRLSSGAGQDDAPAELVRQVSNGDGYEPQKCVVIDEREEVSGSGSFDLGLRTDVLLGCPKTMGLMMALRAPLPELLATDEIGAKGELEALLRGGKFRRKILATAHCRDMEELRARSFFRRLLETGLIKRVVFLSGKLGRGTVEAVYGKRESRF